eukprot:scaffold374483_cov13-Prasinocladus_malaysianus.AAC.1
MEPKRALDASIGVGAASLGNSGDHKNIQLLGLTPEVGRYVTESNHTVKGFNTCKHLALHI